ncbi:MAG: c-type cytochrome biogenesis protein CcmI [Pseudohongiellaceae bacterium]
MFWIASTFLFILATLFVVIPIWRGRTDEGRDIELRKEANIALFHERHEDLKAELEAKNIDQQQFDQLTAELQHTLLADVSSIEASKPSNQKNPKADKTRIKRKEARVKERFFSTNHMVPFILACILPVAAYVLYDRWGYFNDVQMMDLFQRTVDNRDDPEEAQALIVSLGESVQGNQDQPWTWYFLAENFANIGMFNEAQIAYSRSADLLEETPEKALILGRVAMVMYINAGLQFTPEILEVIEQARGINPNEISILQLLASNAAENEDHEAAIRYWRLLIQANPNSEQAQQLRLNIVAAQEILRQQGYEAASEPIIDVNVALADGLELNDSIRVFVAARNADQEGMPPLAATSLVVANLPTTIRLDNSSAVGPFNLSSAENIYVSALVSYAGIAMPQTGDYRVVSENFTHNNDRAEIDLIITDQIQ